MTARDCGIVEAVGLVLPSIAVLESVGARKHQLVPVIAQNDRPFAKVIDFGIAQAIAQRLTDETLFTRYDQFLGMPQDMSPEQAAGSMDIDTRTVNSPSTLLNEGHLGACSKLVVQLHHAAAALSIDGQGTR